MSAEANRADRLRSPGYRRYFLFVFVTMTAFGFMDRVLFSTLGQAIKVDLGLSDTQIGFLGGLSIALFYAVFAIPSARLAERHTRTVIVAIAVAIWAVMTTLCGLVHNFGQLLAARIGVGVGESGQLATQSLISDMFPPNRRATALGILNIGVTIGIVFGAIASGVLAQAFGWRAAFFVLGLPGLALAVTIFLTIDEPPRGFSDVEVGVASEKPPPFRAVFALAFSKRSFVHMLAGATLVGICGSGVLQFMHPFFVRQFHMSYAQAAAMFGIINGVTSGFGFFAGGFLSDRFAKHDKRYYGLVPAVGLAIAAPLFILGFLQTDWRIAMAILAIPGMFSATYFAPTYAVAHNIVLPRMRASITAIVSLGTSLTSMAVGPTLTGFVSDRSAAYYFGSANFIKSCPGGHAPVLSNGFLEHACESASALGVRNALILSCTLLFWASLHYLLSSRSLEKDFVA